MKKMSTVGCRSYMTQVPNLPSAVVRRPEVRRWSRLRIAFGIYTHIARCSQAIGVCLKAGSLPKNATKTIKQMARTAREILVRGPIVTDRKRG